MHRPSALKLWQIPAFAAEPIPPGVFCRVEPDDEQEASYFAASDSILSFSDISIKVSSCEILLHTLYHTKVCLSNENSDIVEKYDVAKYTKKLEKFH